ncbi:anthranilate phosphoribosyltransferase [Thermoanaerobacterium thermosaccharolyticum]|uniref:anthranilate phosphoribosyltransferase n=1 Tax=Thermoanaerobacterium thermosaccharolyticum TaxID=1517 RepID=UPI00123B95CC|nr:anthranilate phosphoribosyltransferase [Thermoanaerobacterium thermosaccharolyticum]KAA5805665.1 anthranilate phosphoribosyltransferase [Thermoanaerobacterium thermosaccharolyticum]
MLKEAIEKIVIGENLTESEAKSAMDSIMKGESSSALIGGYLIGLRMKGETIDEITGSAKSMIGNAVRLKLDSPYVIDTCGTGGDGGRTFNISTAVAIITSSAGVKIAKHGNRAVSSKSGSADVLSELGVKIDLEPEITKKFIDDVGFGFLYAPKYHSAMKNVAPIRRELGLRTVFNILGPLTNPASVKGQVLGVYDKKLTHVLAEVLLKLGCERALVVYGNDGLDEITTTTTTTVSEVKNGTVIDYTIDPHDYGINLSKDTDINGGDSKENAKIILDILEGQKGPKRDIVVLNSAAALYVGKAVDNIKEGVMLAEHLIDSGAALGKLNEILSYQKVYLQ